ncbi:MAG: hypothetical protein GX591_09310, partial [Planctomycetes bacterium]|nr:hypothetical protein [Planctomycetota bacterium]
DLWVGSDRWVNLDAYFRQTGGTADIGELVIDTYGTYEYVRGGLNVGNLVIRGTLDLSGAEQTFALPSGVVEWREGTVAASGASLHLGPNTLLIQHPGLDLPSRFASSTVEGLVVNAGEPITIPAGRTIEGTMGNDDQYVHCYGSLLSWDRNDTPRADVFTGEGIALNAGLRVYDGGHADLGNGRLRTDNAGAQLDDGVLIAEYEEIGAAGFLQTAGRHEVGKMSVLGEYLAPAGHYTLQDGHLLADRLYVGSHAASMTGRFIQNGGSAAFGQVTVHAGNRYEATGGTIHVERGLNVFGQLDLTSRAIAITTGSGLLDFSDGEILNAAQATVAAGDDSLTVLPAGGSPFASLTSSGFVVGDGETVAIPAGRTVRWAGSIDEPLDLYGTIDSPELNLRTGIRVHGGADATLGDVFTTNTTSGVTGGTLAARTCSVDDGLFTQTGGVVRAGTLMVGNVVGEAGYQLTGPGTIEAGILGVGMYNANGRFTQTHGEVTAGTLRVYDLDSYTLSGTGALTVDKVHFSGRAAFLQAGGTFTVHGALELPTDSSYAISGGTVQAGSIDVSYADLKILSADATILLTDALHFTHSAKLQTVPGAAVHMRGASLVNEAQGHSALLNLNLLALLLDGGEGRLSDLEAGSPDLGPVVEGFDHNFAMAGLSIGADQSACARLVDAFDNNRLVEGPEAMYVHTLVLGPGGMLDLNGCNLYYLHGQIDPAATILLNGGQLALVPEPACLGFLVCGALFLLRRRQRPRG